MAYNPFTYRTARQTTGYPAAKKPARSSIYAAPQAPVSSPYSSFLSTTGYQPAAPERPQMQLQPTAAPAAPSAAHVAATTVTAPQSFDFHTDPILQQINAIGTKSRSDADSAALAAKKQIATTYGDSDYAKNVLGDSATADAAAQNPYGQYAQLAKQNLTNAGNLDESLNSHNLYFSGARIKQQGDLADQYGKAVAGTAANEQQALDATEQQRLAAYLAADQADAQAQQDAQLQALQQALLNQPAPTFDLSGLYGSGGGGGAGDIVGPGPVAAPSNPIVDAYPYGTQTQTTGAATGQGGPVPMGNYIPGRASGDFSISRALAASPTYAPAAVTTADANAEYLAALQDAEQLRRSLASASSATLSPYGSAGQRKRQAL